MLDSRRCDGTTVRDHWQLIPEAHTSARPGSHGGLNGHAARLAPAGFAVRPDGRLDKSLRIHRTETDNTFKYLDN